MVDACWGHDDLFPFDCGSSTTVVSCGRDQVEWLSFTGRRGGTSTVATSTSDPEATSTGVPSSGQSVAGPDETGNADGSDSEENNGGSNSNAMAIGLGVGLGVGIPLVLIGAGVLSFCVWRTKKLQAAKGYEHPPVPTQQSPDQWASPSTFVSGNGSENKHMSELLGAGQMNERYELSPDSNRTSEMP